MKKIILMAACVIAFAACDNGATKRAAQDSLSKTPREGSP